MVAPAAVPTLTVVCAAPDPRQPRDAPRILTRAEKDRITEECSGPPGQGLGGNACANAGARMTLSPSLATLLSECHGPPDAPIGARQFDACIELATRYRDGIDVPVDHVRAYEFARLVCGRVGRWAWGTCTEFGGISEHPEAP